MKWKKKKGEKGSGSRSHLGERDFRLKKNAEKMFGEKEDQDTQERPAWVSKINRTELFSGKKRRPYNGTVYVSHMKSRDWGGGEGHTELSLKKKGILGRQFDKKNGKSVNGHSRGKTNENQRKYQMAPSGVVKGTWGKLGRLRKRNSVENGD